MTNKLAARYVSMLQVRREAGATALEYVGMLVVAAIIVAAISSVITPGAISGAVTTAVNTILGTGGG